MYESIHGQLIAKDAASVVVTASGIGYRIQVPLSTYERLPARGDAVELLLHLVVRDDEWRLMGFATEEERGGFRALLRVNGVGPALALSVLGGLTARQLRQALAESDVRALTRVKGVGKKTAERILVELGDTWRTAVPTPDDAGGMPDAKTEAMRALESLGHKPEEARKRVERAHAALSGEAAQAENTRPTRSEDPSGEDLVADLVRHALRQ